MHPPRPPHGPPPHNRPPLGPRPLPLHLALQGFIALSSQAALPLLKSGSISWSAPLKTRARKLEQNLAAADPDAFARALARQTAENFGAFIKGVRAYRAAPRQGRETPGHIVWRKGTTRLVDFTPGPGAYPPSTYPKETPAQTILLVPSLINRAHILDLAHGRSVCRWLAQSGFRPLLVDWDAPGVDERTFTLDDYIIHRLEPALAQAVSIAGGPVHVGGYCMGGLLATALVQRMAPSCASLSLIATPWDFHAYERAAIAAIGLHRPLIEALTQNNTPLGVDIIQTLFTLFDPFSAGHKFRRFAAMSPTSKERDIFVRLEDWLGDGVPLSARVARQTLLEWFGNNAPFLGTWTVAANAVRPERLTLPVFAAIAHKDRIVPRQSADALIDKISHAHRLDVNSGHVGMIVGRSAQEIFYEPWGHWLKTHT